MYIYADVNEGRRERERMRVYTENYIYIYMWNDKILQWVYSARVTTGRRRRYRRHSTVHPTRE